MRKWLRSLVSRFTAHPVEGVGLSFLGSLLANWWDEAILVGLTAVIGAAAVLGLDVADDMFGQSEPLLWFMYVSGLMLMTFAASRLVLPRGRPALC